MLKQLSHPGTTQTFFPSNIYISIGHQGLYLFYWYIPYTIYNSSISIIEHLYVTDAETYKSKVCQKDVEPHISSEKRGLPRGHKLCEPSSLIYSPAKQR